jgi:hypothetical protein
LSDQIFQSLKDVLWRNGIAATISPSVISATSLAVKVQGVSKQHLERRPMSSGAMAIRSDCSTFLIKQGDIGHRLWARARDGKLDCDSTATN